MGWYIELYVIIELHVPTNQAGGGVRLAAAALLAKEQQTSMASNSTQPAFRNPPKKPLQRNCMAIEKGLFILVSVSAWEQGFAQPAL
jgi:hypothetical protein